MKKKSLLKKITAISLLMAVVAMVLSGVVLFALFRNRAMENMKKTLSESIMTVWVTVGQYEACDWLFSYWHDNYEDMYLPPYEDEREYQEWTEKCSEFSRMNLASVTEEEILAMPKEKQHLFAEYCYIQIFNDLSMKAAFSGLDYISCYMPEESENQAVAIFQASKSDSGLNEYKAPLGEVWPLTMEAHPKLVEYLASDSMLNSDIEIFRSTTDGKPYASIYTGIYQDQKPYALISITESISETMNEVWSDVFRFELWIALVILAALAILLQCIYHNSLKPTLQMEKDILSYADDPNADALAERLDTLIRREDEIGSLAKNFHAMADKIEHHYNEIIRLTGEKEHLEGELSMAANLKAHLMPNVYPAFPEEPSIDIFADQLTATGVGGDYYDFFRMDEDHIVFAMADIFAGGSVSALYMIVFKVILYSISRFGFSVDQTVQMLNDRLCLANEDDLSLSAWIGILEISTGKVEAVNAGHETAILVQGGKAAMLEEEIASYPLGLIPELHFNSFTFILQLGEQLVLYTDGAYVLSDASGRSFDAECIMEVLQDGKERNAEKTVALLQETMLDCLRGEALTEDISLLCLMRVPPDC